MPKYTAIATSIRNKIYAGEYAEGTQLPNEEKLCEIFAVSRGTLREAIRLLVDEGLIRREHGRGTFVSEKRNSSLFTLASFDEEMLRKNRAPSTRLLKAEVMPADEVVAAKLGLAVGESVIHIVRLRLADGQPVAYEVRYLAEHLCPNLLAENLADASIHFLLVYKFDISLIKLNHSVEIVELSAEDAARLDVEPNTSAFAVDRVSFTRVDDEVIPAVWFQALYRQELYQFSVKAKDSL